MAVLTGAYETYDSAGLREDLMDVIYNIDPVETPMMSGIGRGSASAITHEWLTDILDTAAFNIQDEGNESVFSEPTAPVRPHNITQISEKTIAVSGTIEAVDKAGRGSELSYQLARLSKSLKRDMEFTITQNQQIQDGASGTPRSLASYECWIAGVSDGTASRGTNGLDPVITAGTPIEGATGDPFDGTQRPLLETFLKSVIQNVWNNGGNPSLLITGPFNKTVVSTFSGNSTRFDKGEDKRLVSAIDIYVSDFGDHRIVPDRFSRDRSLLVITPELWSVDYLRPFAQKPLAVTGDSQKRLLNVEFTLRASSRIGSGVVADLTTS